MSKILTEKNMIEKKEARIKEINHPETDWKQEVSVKRKSSNIQGIDRCESTE